jgi:LPS export ABC transporter protein LptC
VGLAQEAKLPIKGMRIPLELFEDGRVKMQFSAARARVPEGRAEMEASEVLVESFEVDGSLAMIMEADTCWYNRTTGRLDSDGPVRMDRGDMEITGVGMEWKASEQKLRLYSDVRVVLKGNTGLGKVLPERRTAEQPDSRTTKRKKKE